MKSLVLALTLLSAMTGFGAAAQAQNGPWWAHYDFGSDETVNCGFYSFRQCVDVRGVGGFCAQNSTYGLRGPRRRPTAAATRPFSNRCAATAAAAFPD